MIKKITLLSLILFLVSCSISEEPNYQFKLLTIDDATTPQSFTFGTMDTISVKYTLPNSCYYYHSLYYQYQDSTRIVAIRAVQNLEANCTEAAVQKELKFPIKVLQREDYLFKFWKGKDANGKDLFEEKIVPVN